MQPLTWTTLRNLAILGVSIVFVLWIAGFIGSFWAGLGVLAVGFAVLTVSRLSEWRRTAIILVVGWAFITIVKPVVWNSSPPVLQEAASSAGSKGNTRLAETFRGHGADALQQLAMYCSEREQQRKTEVDTLRKNLIGLQPADEDNRADLELELQTKVREIEEWRQNCTENFQYSGDTFFARVGGFFGAVAAAFPPNDPKEWFDFLGILLLGGLGLYFSKKEVLWRNRIGGIMLLAFVFFSARFIIFETSLTKPFVKGWEEATREETSEEKAATEKATELAREKTEHDRLAAVVPGTKVIRNPLRYQIDALSVPLNTGIPALRVELDPSPGDVVTTAYMLMPRCVSTQVNVLTRSDNLVLRVKNGTVGENMYRAGSDARYFPLILGIGSFLQLEARSVSIVEVRCL